MSKEKEEKIPIPENRLMNSLRISLNANKELLFETAYEKVLFIINKAKEFIKNIAPNEIKLIEEIDWVIKIIVNRSLYTYELVREKKMKQNEEYEKFINFVKKYNEEVIQMNKKHDIVAGILNIRKKEDILMKPSLFLKKIENIDKVKEIKPKKKNNFVEAFGKYVLSLYEKTKKNNNDKNININTKEENKNNNITENIENEKQSKNNEIHEENKKDNNTINNNEINSNPIHKKVCFENDLIIKKEDTNNTKRVKVFNKALSLKSKSNTKLVNPNLPELHRRKIRDISKLTRVEKNNFNNIKNIMRNYYLKFAFNDHLIINARSHLSKPDSNNRQNNIISAPELVKKYQKNQEKVYHIIKTNRQGSLPYNLNIKNKYNFPKNNKISLSIQTNNDSKEDRPERNKNIKNRLKTEKLCMPYKSNDTKRNLKTIDIKIENINQVKRKKNSYINNNFEINIIKKDQSIPLDTLINDYIDEVKTITSFDFNIFELKKVIGYNNVLPLMGYTILKTLGLVDNKIISTKKLESFLKTVSDNYRITTLYHNSLHGADVTQSLLVFFLNSNFEEICETTVLDLLGMILSALGHDLGHPGLNNGYHVNAKTDLGITYNDKSCLENFHSCYLFKILKVDDNNILEKFSVTNFKTIRKRMISQILATDMANHGENISSIRAKIRSEMDQERFIFLSGNEKTKFDEQQLLLNYLIHMADLGHNCKLFNICKIWIKLLCEEFWQQGDKEREKGLTISFMCDRNNIDVPSSQVGFLKGFILTSFDCLVTMFPKLQFTIDNAQNNIKEWTKLQNEKNLLGWTPPKNKKNKRYEDNSEEN